MIHCTEAERQNYEEVGRWRSLPQVVPSVVFQTRVQNVDGDYEWEEVSTWDLFAAKRVLLFSLPGAFTPTCSTYQLPNFEKLAPAFDAEGIDAVYCFTVNDAFVCNAWAKANNLNYVKVIPDGNGQFTRDMEMLVDKENLGFGPRSWRYACVVENGHITDWFIEEGKEDNHGKDPYLFTNPQYILDHLND